MLGKGHKGTGDDLGLLKTLNLKEIIEMHSDTAKLKDGHYLVRRGQICQISAGDDLHGFFTCTHAYTCLLYTSDAADER